MVIFAVYVFVYKSVQLGVIACQLSISRVDSLPRKVPMAFCWYESVCFGQNKSLFFISWYFQSYSDFLPDCSLVLFFPYASDNTVVRLAIRHSSCRMQYTPDTSVKCLSFPAADIRGSSSKI